MGFWQTGYKEFHERAGLEGTFTLGPKIYRCQHCTLTFPSADALRVHRFQSHPYDRPLLLLDGVEAGTTPMRITGSLDPANVMTSRCDRSWINGALVAPEDLGRQLAQIRNDSVTIRLANDNVSAEFTLRFEIAAVTDLEGVDRCFLDVARRGRLDRRAVEDFITMSRGYPTAMGYCDGICEYFYGVLIKERSPESSLPYARYREKFNRAVDALQDIERPLARVICALIAFHFNHFSRCLDVGEVNRVDVASGRFERWIAGDLLAAGQLPSRPRSDALERLLTDFEAERLLQWSVASPEALLSQIDDMESMARTDLAEFDRTKLRILLAELYASQGRVSEAKRHLRELRNNQALGDWAERLLVRVGETS
jgi:hypothetical protein